MATIADHCHGRGIVVIVADTRGVFGTVFCDFGPSFVVSDASGEQAASAMIAGITKDSPALVTVLEETRHNMETGDKVCCVAYAGNATPSAFACPRPGTPTPPLTHPHTHTHTHTQIVISDVVGMEELNGREFTITVKVGLTRLDAPPRSHIQAHLPLLSSRPPHLPGASLARLDEPLRRTSRPLNPSPNHRPY